MKLGLVFYEIILLVVVSVLRGNDDIVSAFVSLAPKYKSFFLF